MFFKKKSAGGAPTGPVEYLLVGLGNPGREYENTRHNIGFLTVDRLAAELNVRVDRLKFKALTGDAMLGDSRVLLMKPSTFMNNSGEAVREAMQFYKLPPERVLVVFDDVSLDLGRLRVRLQGSDGGHNGIKSILYQLGSDQFPRIKLGVGKKPHPDYDLAAWVLGKLPADAAKTIDTMLDSACAAAKLIVAGKADQAMNQFNRDASV